MRLNKRTIFTGFLKLNLIANTFIMYVCFESFRKESQNPMDPITGDARAWWSWAFLAALLLSAVSLFSRNKKIRSGGLLSGGLLLMGLGITYVLGIPTMTIGLWFIFALGILLLSGAGVIFFLPENLNNLIELDNEILTVEKNLISMKDYLQQMESEVNSLKEKIVDEKRE